jgi:hypothetical protein
MKIPEKLITTRRIKSNSRTIIGISMILLSFLAAALINKESNRTVLVWGSYGELAPGDVIAQSDLIAIRVMLPENSRRYLSVKADVIGTVVLRKLGAHELIPADSLSNAPYGIDTRATPIEVLKNDLPMDLSRGSIVDIYALPNEVSQSAGRVDSTHLVASEISVVSVDQKSKDLGGSVGVVISLPISEVVLVLGEVPLHRIVLVKHG